MDQEKTGKFIASCRKAKGMTQAVLAEKLGITDRAVSKWETGRCLPDASIMLELCGLLDINVNELLLGEHIIMDDYKEIAEQNLIEMRKLEEQANKKLLSAASFTAIFAAVTSLLLMIAGSYLAEYNAVAGVILILSGSFAVTAAIIYAVTLEHDAGYYECPECKKRYVPEMRSVVMAIHYGTTRKMRCPYCHKKGWHKKVLTRSDK